MSPPISNELDRSQNPEEDTNVVGPVSKRKAKRALDRNINKKAVDIDKAMREQIKEGAEQLDVSEAQLSQRFAVIAPVGEQRAPMWWNGFISNRAAAWKSEYAALGKPGKEYLGWVTKRIREENLKDKVTDEEKIEYAKQAEEKRAENKEALVLSLTRKKTVSVAQQQLDSIYQQLQRLNRQVGIEFTIFATRGSLEDELEPFYGSSEKATTFLQGHMNLPLKELLTLMDLWVIGGVKDLSSKMKSRKEVYRLAVRTKLNTSFCTVIKTMGHNTSDFRYIQYSNYSKLIHDYKVILRGYPLTLDCKIVRPSDFPGGIKGLTHADTHLGSGSWGFEKISDAVYDEWKAQSELATLNDLPTPAVPYLPVPGTEFKAREELAENGEPSKGRKRKGESISQRPAKKSKVTVQKGVGKGKKVAPKYKSSELIEESSEDEEEHGSRESTPDSTSSDSDADEPEA